MQKEQTETNNKLSLLSLFVCVPDRMIKHQPDTSLLWLTYFLIAKHIFTDFVYFNFTFQTVSSND